MEITIKGKAESYNDILSKIDGFMLNNNCILPISMEKTISSKICFKCLKPILEEYKYLSVNLHSSLSRTTVYVHHYHYQ